MTNSRPQRAFSLRRLLQHPLFWILLVALVLRMAAALVLGNTVRGLSGAQDEITYSMLGHRFVQGFGLTFPENWYPWIKANTEQAYFSDAISYYLAAIYALFGYQPLAARVVTGLISTASVGLIYLLGARLFGKTVGLVAAGIAAVYAYLIYYGVTLVTEPLFILALLVTMLITYSILDRPSLGKWLALGVTLALAVLLRMAVIFFVMTLLVWLAWRVKQRRWQVLIPLVVIVLAIIPFTIQNYQMFGRFMLLEANFGHVFWNGNHPDSLGNFHPYRVFPIPPEVLALDNDVDITNELLRRGIQNVINDPGLFVMLTITRLREFFLFWPTAESDTLANLLRVFSFGLMWPFAVAGLWLSRRQWRDLLPIYIFMLMHTGVYAVTWTMVRYRVPLDAFLIPFAAVAGVQLFTWLLTTYRGRKPDQAALVSPQ
jgi:4-amino-4-deoxy-L-arabinose transferase-like glycosyltransferase